MKEKSVGLKKWGLCDRNFIELVEANNYHHMYLTFCVHNLTFLITMIC